MPVVRDPLKFLKALSKARVKAIRPGAESVSRILEFDRMMPESEYIEQMGRLMSPEDPEILLWRNFKQKNTRLADQLMYRMEDMTTWPDSQQAQERLLGMTLDNALHYPTVSYPGHLQEFMGKVKKALRDMGY